METDEEKSCTLKEIISAMQSLLCKRKLRACVDHLDRRHTEDLRTGSEDEPKADLLANF